MKIFFKEFRVSTHSRFEIVDITHLVESAIRESGICNGMVLIHLPHATAALVANENERGLLEDLITLIKEVFKPERDWKHNLIDDNAHAHLASAFIGASRVFPIKDCRLYRGTWQHILLVELDGPRDRRVLVEVIGS